MRKKPTITADEQVSETPQTSIGRQHRVMCDLVSSYRQMASEEEREREAFEWAEEMLGDVIEDKLESAGRLASFGKME